MKTNLSLELEKIRANNERNAKEIPSLRAGLGKVKPKAAYSRAKAAQMGETN
jgi:hypothetical protein